MEQGQGLVGCRLLTNCVRTFSGRESKVDPWVPSTVEVLRGILTDSKGDLT